jgi:hypothetical protein
MEENQREWGKGLEHLRVDASSIYMQDEKVINCEERWKRPGGQQQIEPLLRVSEERVAFDG